VQPASLVTLAVGAIMSLCSTPVVARTLVLTRAQLVGYEQIDSTACRYYALRVVLPPDIVRVQHAWLELHADVIPEEGMGFTDPAPLFQVYVLSSAPVGATISGELLRTPRIPMSRPVAAGTNRLIRINITEYVREIAAEPSLNHGLVIGAVLGDSVTTFIPKAGKWGADVVARVLIE
jgi:hypothetical protein